MVEGVESGGGGGVEWVAWSGQNYINIIILL